MTRTDHTSSTVLPAYLRQILNGADSSTREAAWEALVSEQSRLLLHVARSVAVQHDGVMDAYAFVLERLRQDDYRRLRSYRADGRSAFATWLVVVARRLCHDFHRQRYGRARGLASSNGHGARHGERRRLQDLIGVSFDDDVTEVGHSGAADADVRRAQLQDALEAAVASLHPEDRLILKLRYEDDLTGRAIAEVLGLRTTFHAFRRVNAILDRLRAELRSRGIEDGDP